MQRSTIRFGASFMLSSIACAIVAAASPRVFAANTNLLKTRTPTMLCALDTPLTVEEAQKSFNKISDQVKEFGEKAIAEAKKGVDQSTANKEKIDELLQKQGELVTRLQEAEQKLAKRTAADTQEQSSKTAGLQMVEDEAFKAWVAAGGMKSTQSGFVFPVKNITSLNAGVGAAGAGIAPDRQGGVIQTPNRRLTIRDLLTPGRTSSNLVQYVKETGFVNNAATVSETVQKPQSDITYALMQSAVVTIAHWIKASKQILDDFAGLQSNIDGRLRYGLGLVEENQLLKGSGVGNNLNGIYTQATPFAAPIVISGATKIDTIRLMLLQAEIAMYPATGIVLHPSDWAAIELTKDTTGGYIFANPQSLANPALWGRPVVSTQAITQDTALVGAFQLGAQIFDREDANVVISTENQDDFIKNMVTIRGEERLALAVYRPEAFIKNTDLPAT
jgi:HK97 family phage major capsid protein